MPVDNAAPLGLAFLGCGAVTRMHSATLRKVAPEVRRHYASRSADRARAFRSRFGGAGDFGSYDAALADPRIDIVLVATPPPSHLEWTQRALRAGKHVIVEKPPFLRSSDFDAVEQAANGAGRRVFVAENYYYKPVLVQLRRIIVGQELGEVRFIQLNALKQQRVSGWREERGLAGGGALFEGGIHWIDFMANMGLDLVRIRGVRPAAAHADGVDRSMLVVGEYAGGAVATLAYSWEIPSTFRGLRLSRVFGTRGSVTFESNGLFLISRGRRWRVALTGSRDFLGYGAMFRDFLRALRTGAPAGYTMAKARRDLELVEQVYRTAAAGG